MTHSRTEARIDLHPPEVPLLEEHLRLTQEHSPIGLAVVSLDGRWIDVNPALCRLLKRTQAELLSLTFQDITHPDDLDSDLALLQRLLAGEIDAYEIEKRYVLDAGGTVWVQLNVALVRSEAGDPLYFVSQIQDITDKKQSSELLDLLFETSPDLLAIANFDGYFVRVNPSWTEALGWSADELMAKPFEDFVHPDDTGETHKEYEELRPVGASSDRFENRYRAKDGTYRWLQWNSVALPDRGWIIAIARDITDQKAQAVELIRSNTDLANFAAVISHDLRSPLTTVMGFAMLLRASVDALDQTRIIQCADSIVSSSQRMNELINAVLAYSGADKAGRDVVEVHLDNVVEGVIADLGAAIETAGARVEIDISLPSVKSDAAVLRQVLQNLVANALKFARPDAQPVVEITSSKQDDECVVSVTDNGIGMTDEDEGRVFDPFCQGDRGRERGGLGLGLATCKRFVERLGGRIWLTSQEGHGTTVSFSIPL